MQTANTVDMAGDLNQIVALAADIERWPTILPHYRWVTLLEGGGDRKTVEMAARRGRIPVKWRAIQEIERSGEVPIIRFRHIGGVTKGMEVAWTFANRGDSIAVRIDPYVELTLKYNLGIWGVECA
ncbi:SRPBCC family protein [Nitrosomonas communis]|uniref:SRPBCC family protein n=1 Tax=Nitrosomonas communis TaxID=44574 RepID=UPI003D28AA14